MKTVAMIPENVYQMVEVKLRNRRKMAETARKRLNRARECATDISAPAVGQIGGKNGHRKSRVEKAALRVIEAEKDMEETMKWLDVFSAMDRIFPASTNEGVVAMLMYGSGMSQEEVCRFTKCTRVTIRRRRDRYVIRTALLAARKGLIAEEEVIAYGGADPEERSPGQDE